ncbi:MAG: tetratricopeptide repeat protein [Bacteroidetes bacterium]|nr:tetratricopeptide repeat protein [Bacteroidota bacterium]MBS1755894.1 tetratricopeptide repeat protein [Bacteroidota bacterium]
MKHKLIFSLFAAAFCITASAQATHAITDPDIEYKQAKEHIAKEEYAFAYPMIKDLKNKYPENAASNRTYINDDIDYYYVVCELKLLQDIGKDDAVNYIASVNNEPRRQIMSFHLGHYYFLKNDYEHAIEYFNKAGYDNLSNEQIADAKFEKAYALFNLRQFAEAKPLFDEIHQLPANKYYIPANYYYGFISYYDRQYNEALSAFKLVETFDDYKGVVPYYIAEIYYFQGKKDMALTYGESVLKRGTRLYYDKQLKLLIGQIYFEKQDYDKAQPLLEEYVNNTSKVTKEVLYELSYCYYKSNQYEKAISGFKQLSNERDSMGQNSMYLLGGLYLKTNQKANARNAFQYSAYNSSNKKQQQISLFNYAKLSYELGYQDIALKEMKNYIRNYPNSEYDTEAKEILVNLLTNTNNYNEALAMYESFKNPTASMQKAYPRILYGRAIDYINDQQLLAADDLLSKVLDNNLSGSILPYANFWKGEIAYRLQQYDGAIQHLTLYLQSNAPSQGEASPAAAKYDLGYSWMQKQNFKQALFYFEQIAKTTSASATAMEQDAFLRSADCNYMLKDFARANSMYQSVVANALQQSDYALYQQGMIAGVKNSAEKVRILNSLIKQYPSSSLVPDVNMEIALTYIADENFNAAVPFLNNILASNASNAGGLKPKAYLKLGLAYYNANNNAQALNSYQQLIQKYPQSPEADEAMGIIKDIYVEEGRPNDYVDLMKKNGKAVSVTEADSLTYTAALIKYNANDCAAAIAGFNNYLGRYANGAYTIDANYYSADCYEKNKDWANALKGYAYVNAKGLNKYFEKASLAAARINYFEIKDFAAAKKYFESVRSNAVNQDNILEALRGLVRSDYQLKDYASANDEAKELLTKKGITTDDRSIGFLVLGKSQQVANDCNAAIASFKSCAAINKSSWGAEARYEIAHCYFGLNNLSSAEKAAMAVIKETGSYDFWVTKSYILLGDIFMQQKDYFNAKATYESVAKNSTIDELKTEAQQKFDKAAAEEKQNSKIGN